MNAQQLERVRTGVGEIVRAGRQYHAHHGTKSPPAWLETWAEAENEQESKGGTAPPLVEELLKSLMTTPHADANANPHHYTPPITTQLIAQIKTLPQLSNKAFIIAEGQNYGILNSMGLDGVPWVNFYCVFTVDMTRYRKEKMTSNVFELRQWPGFQLTESHTKCLIGSFATACLQYYQIQLVPKSAGADEPLYRPSQVFFETKDDVDNPQVQLFLTMMGMESSHIQVITPEMRALLEENMDAVTYKAGKKAFPQDTFPHISDMRKGIACGNCCKTGPQLLMCACGEAYYCNTECQKAVWNQHKNTHKKALSNKKHGENVQHQQQQQQQQAQPATATHCVESMLT